MDQKIKIKDYRIVRNPKLLQFIKREWEKKLTFQKSCTISLQKTIFSINETYINEIYTYTPFSDVSQGCLNVSELILQKEVENLQEKQDIFNFCTSNKCLKFQLIKSIINFSKGSEAVKRYASHSFIIETFEFAHFPLKNDDLIFNCTLPGTPITDVYYIVERNNGDKIERILFERNTQQLPTIVKPQLPKKSFLSFLTNLFFSSIKRTIKRDGNQYDRLEHSKLD